MKTKSDTKSKIILCIIETIVFNWVVYYLFYLVQPNQEVYLSLNPHPLLFLALFMGIRYGIKLSTISSVISCIFFISIFWFINRDFSLFFNYFTYYKYPLLFLWVAVIFGAFKDNYTRKLKLANDEIETLQLEYKHLEKDFTILDVIQKELKQQIIGSDETITSLYDISSKLETFETEDIFTETIGVLIKYLKATKITLFTHDDINGYLRLKLSYGDVSEKQNSIKTSNCSWFIEVEKARKVVKIIDQQNDEVSPLMSAPLIRDNKIIAVVNIESMDFDLVSEYAYNLFQLIIDWINTSLDKAKYVETLRADRFIENTQLVTPQYFKKRVEVEHRRKVEFGMNYSFLAYKVINMSIEEMDKLVQKTLRPVDIAYYNFKSNTLSFLLPATSKVNNYILEQKIQEIFKSNLKPIELKPMEE